MMMKKKDPPFIKHIVITGCHICGREFAPGEIPHKEIGEYNVHVKCSNEVKKAA